MTGFFLPETSHLPLPTTLEEALSIEQNNKYKLKTIAILSISRMFLNNFDFFQDLFCPANHVARILLLSHKSIYTIRKEDIFYYFEMFIIFIK